MKNSPSRGISPGKIWEGTAPTRSRASVSRARSLTANPNYTSAQAMGARRANNERDRAGERGGGCILEAESIACGQRPSAVLRSLLVAGERYTTLSQEPCFRIAGRRSPVREVAGFQAECFDGSFRKQSVRFNPFIRGHHGRNDRRGLDRISFGHEKDRANRWAAT